MPKGSMSIDQALTTVAFGYKNAALIADQVFPAISVGKQSGKVYKFGKDAFRLDDDIRAPGTKSHTVQSFSVLTDSYFCDNHALNDVVANEDVANADAAVNPEVAMTEGLVAKIKLRREYTLAAYLFNATTFSGKTAAVTTKWSDYAASDPVGDVDASKETVRQNSGSIANTGIMGQSVFNKLKRHPMLLDMFKYSSKGVLTEQMVAEALGLKRILVGGAVYNSAKEGATAVMADVWGNYFLTAYIADAPGLRTPSLGYSYLWKTGIGGYEVYRTVEDEAGSRHGIIVEVMNFFDDICTMTDCGYLYSAVI